jgi:hypothetical protein
LNRTQKDIHLYDELLTSRKLIEIGFGEYQNLDIANDFYHLPFQLLASGLERLLKCHICFAVHEKSGNYPEFSQLKKCGGRNGHDIIELKKTILAEYFSVRVPALKDDYGFLSNNEKLDELLYLLSEFGKYARYYNFDIVTASAKPSIDASARWQEFESGIIRADPGLLKNLDNFDLQNGVLKSAQRTIIVLLERFVRAIGRQFTVGKLGEKALQNSSVYYPFIMMRDRELGTRDYRKKTTRYKKEKREVHERSVKDEIERRVNKDFIHKTINKTDFDGEWPFYHDEVIIECRERHWCIVTIESKDYALNGAAKSRYKLEDVHEAGMAILGVSIGPFIDMALALGEKHES